MAVYVDQIVDYQGSIKGYVGRVSQQWCHLYADTLEELHDMAKRIGMKETWFQPSHLLYLCHYDLTPNKRQQAVRLGAIEVNSFEFARRLVAEDKMMIKSGLAEPKR